MNLRPQQHSDFVENGLFQLAINNLMCDSWKNDTSAGQVHSVPKHSLLAKSSRTNAISSQTLGQIEFREDLYHLSMSVLCGNSTLPNYKERHCNNSNFPAKN